MGSSGFNSRDMKWKTSRLVQPVQVAYGTEHKTVQAFQIRVKALRSVLWYVSKAWSAKMGRLGGFRRCNLKRRS